MGISALPPLDKLICKASNCYRWRAMRADGKLGAAIYTSTAGAHGVFGALKTVGRRDRDGCSWAFLVIFASLALFSGLPAQAQQYTIYTLAGGAPPPISQPAMAASISFPDGAAVDTAGNVYFTSMD